MSFIKQSNSLNYLRRVHIKALLIHDLIGIHGAPCFIVNAPIRILQILSGKSIALGPKVLNPELVGKKYTWAYIVNYISQGSYSAITLDICPIDENRLNKVS